MNKLLKSELKNLLTTYERDAKALRKVLLEYYPDGTLEDALRHDAELKSVLGKLGLDRIEAIEYLVDLDQSIWDLRFLINK